MVSEMVEIFFSQYLANFETRGCGGDFSTQGICFSDASFFEISAKNASFYNETGKARETRNAWSAWSP